MSARIVASKERGHLQLGMVFMVINTCKPVLTWCLAKIGAGHVVESKSTKKNPRRLRCFRYVLHTNQDLAVLLGQLLPHLKIKQQQVKMALHFLRSRASRSNRSAFNEDEIKAVFMVRLANKKSYESDSVIVYKKVEHTLQSFSDLVLQGRGKYQVVEWSKKMDALLGKNADRIIATRLGLKREQVQRRRVQLGIPTFRYKPTG